ncbi:hypothetical protein BDM02DRAFT_1189800 [Thelephora ganbajun]|uniref:Uncharacterized protein n=1 Tax=Thelephora ganbajun TaxID=370292 RepID=A0ACB6ZX80_THEGA|nr:hypothetical protein BDM02DRAFT_1189800 [Thelephora ganbajun]
MASKDYYVEKAATETAGSLVGTDKWALEYINVNYARTILEAFDDDASGFVTIQEVNTFTSARPLDWSLPHWLAYWAVGWQMTCTSYCEKIEEILGAIIHLADEVLPENRDNVNDYISRTWRYVMVWVRSIKRAGGTEELRTKFESYVTAEEARLRQNLEHIAYHINTPDTVKLVVGNSRFETYLFPILYLVLKRDLERISLARKHVLSQFELFDAMEATVCIMDAAWYRMDDLRAIYEQQNVDVKEQLKVFAKGLYQIAHEKGPFFDGDQLRELPDPVPVREEIIPDPDSVPLTILNHPLGTKHEIDFGAYDEQVPVAPPSEEGPDAVLGTWYGFTYENGTLDDSMIILTLNRGDGENSLTASGTQHRASYLKIFTVTGKSGAPKEDGKIPVELKFVYTSVWSDVELTGKFDPEERSLRGTVLYDQGVSTGDFVFKRNPDFVRFRVSPSITTARERWEFAITVVLDRIRRGSWSSRYILQRIKDGRKYMEMSIRNNYYGRRLDADEENEYYRLCSTLLAGDARFYASLIKIKLVTFPIHSIVCDVCRGVLGGGRVLCMDCHDKTTVDLCSEPECLASTITLKYREDLTGPHRPNHSMLKVHRILFSRETVRAERDTKEALEIARQTLSDLKAQGDPMPQCTRCKETVSQPCWYCVDCTEERFICDDCEYKCLAFDDVHTRRHILVRVVEKVIETVVSTEERLRTVEGQLESVHERLRNVEILLSKLLERGSGNSPDRALINRDIQEMIDGPKNSESDNQEVNVVDQATTSTTATDK